MLASLHGHRLNFPFQIFRNHRQWMASWQILLYLTGLHDAVIEITVLCGWPHIFTCRVHLWFDLTEKNSTRRLYATVHFAAHAGPPYAVGGETSDFAAEMRSPRGHFCHELIQLITNDFDRLRWRPYMAVAGYLNTFMDSETK